MIPQSNINSSNIEFIEGVLYDCSQENTVEYNGKACALWCPVGYWNNGDGVCR